MYSWEIQAELEKYNYNIPLTHYNRICNTRENNQISRIKYNPFGNYFEMWTKDDYYWKFYIRKE